MLRFRSLTRVVRVLAPVAAVLLGMAAAARAHDFWIEPSSFTPTPGEGVTLRLLVGERFAGESVPRSDAMIVRFVIAGPEGEVAVRGAEGSDPAGIALVGKAGLHVVGYHSRPTAIEIDAGKFESYLATEGLERVSALRAARGESDQPGRERYSRNARALLAAGDATRGSDAPLGFTLELMAERNPYTLSPGDELPLRLTYDGAPLAGVLVSALNRGHPGATVAARTDAGGHVRLRLASPGDWLVKAVHMIALPPGEDAQWESFWASLTFTLPAPVER